MAPKFNCAFFILLTANNNHLQVWQKPETIVIWILGSIILLSLILFTLFRFFFLNLRSKYENKIKLEKIKSEYKNELQNATILSIENERKRLAFDLHDSVQSHLLSIILKTELNAQKDDIINELSNCVSTIRKVSHNLYPPLIEYKTVDILIKDTIDPWTDYFNFELYLNVLPEKGINQIKKLHIVRILQEILSNAYKYSKSNCININLKINDSYTLISIYDNGVGMSSMNNTGIGVKSIKNRIDIIDGKLKTKFYRGLNYIIYLKNE